MKRLLLIILVPFIFFNNKTQSQIFGNISALHSQAKKYPEYPKIDNKNLLAPSYSSFYKTKTPSKLQDVINNIKQLIGIRNQEWNHKKFEKLLKKLNKKNKYPTEDYILKITPKEKANFVIFTELEGAFHSLVRNLEKLKKLNILNKSLKLKPNNYLIFNGNLLGRSPYILETLTIFLVLKEKNPHNVFLVKGQYEIKDNWLNYGLKKELQIKLERKNLREIPLKHEIEKFLNSCPLAIYIDDQITYEPGFIRISYFDRNFKELDEMYFSHFLINKTSKTIETFNLKNKVIINKNINIKAIIKGLKKITTYKKSNGLNISLPDKGSAAWIGFSSPIKANQILYNFINDAFIILSIKKNNISTINLYKQNALNLDGFKKITYNTYSQRPQNNKFKTIKKISILAKNETSSKNSSPKLLVDNQKEIKIGTTMDLSAELSEAVRYILKGIYLKIAEQNNSGGINNKKIKLIYMDDKYNPQIARKNIELLSKLGIDTLLCPVGSMILKAILPITIKKDMIIMLPEATSTIFRKEKFKNIIHFLGDSEKEGSVLINYLLKQYVPNKIAIFYQPEPFSIEALNAIKKILKKANLIENKDWIATYHLPNSLDISRAKKQIKIFNPEAILLLSTSLVVQNLVNELGLEFLYNKQLLGISTCSGVAFKNFLKEKNLKYINTQLIPDPKKSNLQIVKEFRNAANLAGEPLGGFLLEGYIIADIFIEILKNIKGKITKEKILTAAEEIKNYNYKGIHLHFNPKTREISNTIWLDNGEKVLMITN